LPHLAPVELYDVVHPSDSLHALLSHCTALEHRVHVRSLSLRSLCSDDFFDELSLRSLCSDDFFDELFIDDAPKLEWVLGSYIDYCPLRGMRLTIVHTAKLGFLGYLGLGTPPIRIGGTIFTVR
jgi:hypothetical protein